MMTISFMAWCNRGFITQYKFLNLSLSTREVNRLFTVCLHLYPSLYPREIFLYIHRALILNDVYALLF
ncbi:Hypothetical predicted protein [Olea europaea subsp. europaea]|uniref:Uncharacterized protein n=1 Tax=Olea europaea subsp. europaea TaxID=158383 RepID=A0A8S0RJV1_OLEEU|nr:Hypothetical predicted protein [Olea europaea subsp. europaea]